MPIFPRRTVGAGHARPCRVRQASAPATVVGGVLDAPQASTHLPGKT